jgi:hypothetical protein
MAVMTNDQPIVGAYGDVYTADVGTPVPTDIDDPGAAWTRLGMISEDGASWTPPEEETEEIKIWQSPYPARVVTTGLSSSLSFALDGWDRVTVPFALGGGVFVDDATTVVYHPPGPGESQSKAIFMKVLDGDVKMGLYFPKGRVTSRDDTAFKPDEPALLNVEFSLESYTKAGMSQPEPPYHLVFDSASFPAGGPIVATGATAGTPGTWTPTGAEPPADLATLQSGSVTASPLTGWTTGQYVLRADTGAGDLGHSFWDGNSWESGDAV